MTSEERPPTEAELREAELLARALEDAARPGDEVGPVEDALGAAWLLRASHRAELTELRARAVLERAWPRRRRRWLDPTPGRMAALGAAAAVAAILSALPRGPANLPPPPVPLLRAQLAAARPGTPELGRLEAEMNAYREQVYVALGRTYGKPR